MRKVDARGDACPLPVVKAKKAIAELNGAGEVEVLVDNEIAVQNLTKMAQQKGCRSAAEKAEALFLFRFENFKLCVCGVYAQHCACFFIRFFCGCACCDCFFYHGFLLPFFFSILYLYPVSE